jgi:hypothetical protein
MPEEDLFKERYAAAVARAFRAFEGQAIALERALAAVGLKLEWEATSPLGRPYESPVIIPVPAEKKED